MVVAIINGPNLNLLGKREPEFYGDTDFMVFLEALRREFPEHTLVYFQSNIEGELVDALQKFGYFGEADAIVINAGGYSHTSVAIADAVKASRVPVVNLHISNIYHREPERHADLLAKYSTAQITGMGLHGYRAAITYLLQRLAGD